MRFDDLLADLEDQLKAGGDRELWDEAQSLLRGERARQAWPERLATARSWTLSLSGGHVLRGAIARLGTDWVLVDQPGGEALVRLASLRTARANAEPAPRVSGGVGAEAVGAGRQRAGGSFRAALRLLSRHRPEVLLWVDDAQVTRGRLLQVGLDHAELREETGSSLLVALDGVSAVLASTQR